MRINVTCEKVISHFKSRSSHFTCHVKDILKFVNSLINTCKVCFKSLYNTFKVSFKVTFPTSHFKLWVKFGRLKFVLK